MKTVYLVTLENNSQAGILQSALTNEGIESFTKNEHMASVLNLPEFQVQLYVFEDDFEKALEVVKKGFPYLIGK